MSGPVVLVTSGLGSEFGGVGVVSSLLERAIGSSRARLWRHYHTWPSFVRRAGLGLRALAGGFRRPSAIVYEHVGLAALHAVVPTVREVPHAVFLHGTEVWKPLNLRQKHALVSASLLMANSDFTVRSARAANPWLPEVRIVHLGVRLPAVVPAPARDRPSQVLLVGRMAQAERYKGHDQVLEGWACIRKAVPTASLVIVGGGDDEERIKMKSRQLEGVIFAGRIGDGERDRLYGESRVVMVPSQREGFGLVAVEAAAHGAAIVGLRGTVIEELFPGDEGPALAGSQDPSAIAAAAIPLLADPDEAQRRVDALLGQVRARFLEDHAVARIREALRGLLS